jgi:hypothetical protein
MGRVSKIIKISVRIAGVPTGHLPNKIPERYRYTSLLGHSLTALNLQLRKT